MTSSPHQSAQSSDTRDAEVVSRLQHSELFRQYQDAFQTATALPLSLRPASGACQELHTNTRNVSAFCAFMAKQSATCANCTQMHAKIAAEAAQETCTKECFAGLNDSFVPIRLGERTIAYLQTGQVLFRPATEEQFKSALRQLKMLDPQIDAVSLHEAFFASRVLERPHYDAMLRLLTSFAQHLSILANELMITQSTAEPRAVSKARSFIADHLGESLSLTQVARAANSSPFYFCKIFKAATGLTFTDYVARARVERSKQLMLDTQTRVSEAAFAAGFQSLSQFNRVFRRVTGESPTRFREQIKQGASGSSAAPMAVVAAA